MSIDDLSNCVPIVHFYCIYNYIYMCGLCIILIILLYGKLYIKFVFILSYSKRKLCPVCHCTYTATECLIFLQNIDFMESLETDKRKSEDDIEEHDSQESVPPHESFMVKQSQQ